MASRRATQRSTRWFAAATTTALGAGLGLVALAAPAQATLSSFAPVDVSTNFPAYYQDSAGVRLEPCLDGAPLCFATPADLVAPDGEMFYSRVGSTLNNTGPRKIGKAVLTLALEGAYAGSGSGQEITFSRIRFTATGLTPNSTYTVTHPYGTDTFVTNAAGAVVANVGTEDIGGLGPCLGPTAHAAGGACDFSEAMTGRFGPFLKWDPAVAPAAPAGYLGDPTYVNPTTGLTGHRITGSPTGTNVFKVVGPNIGGPNVNTLSTNLFDVEGKIAGPVMSTPSKLAFGSTVVGTPSTAQSVSVKNIGANPLTISGVALDPTAGNPEDFTVSAGSCTTGLSLARDAACSISVKFTPTATTPRGTRTATVLVNHNGLRNPERIALTGSAAAAGTAPAVDQAFATPLNFAGQRLGTVSPKQTVTVTNSGTADLNVSKVTLGGTDAADFSAQNSCVGVAVAPGASCGIDVVFAPQVKAGDKTATLTITDDANGSPRTVALTGTATSGFLSMGPVDPTTLFPTSYTDSNNLSLKMCLDGPLCLTTAASLVAPGGEGFYNNATAKLTTRNGGKAVLVLSHEGAFAGSTANQQIAFTRIRFTESSGLVPGAIYTVTHPFGVDSYKANASGQVPKNQGTQDIGGLGPCTSATAHNPGGVCDFAASMTGRFGPYLTWDPAVAPAAPAGYVGDAATDHKIVGSPLGTNFFRIEGQGINPTPTVDQCPTVDGPLADCIQTDLFVVAGKLATTP